MTNTDPDPAEARLQGRVGGTPPSPRWVLLRWLSGWALLTWLVRMLAAAIGLRVDADLRIEGKLLRVTRATRFWGRQVREAEDVYRLPAIVGATRSTRYPLMRTLVGACAFALGVGLGAVWFLDGLRGGGGKLLLFGGGIALVGMVLDLVLGSLWPGARERVSLDLDFGGGRRLRVQRVALGDADRFLRAIARGLAGTPG
jgi:hypothetical protein